MIADKKGKESVRACVRGGTETEVLRYREGVVRKQRKGRIAAGRSEVSRPEAALLISAKLVAKA